MKKQRGRGSGAARKARHRTSETERASCGAWIRGIEGKRGRSQAPLFISSSSAAASRHAHHQHSAYALAYALTHSPSLTLTLHSPSGPTGTMRLHICSCSLTHSW